VCALVTVGVSAAFAGDTLLGGQTLSAGQSLSSADGRYLLAMQSDGNLVLYLRNGAAGERALWSSVTSGDTGDHALLQTNGALVLLDSGGQTLWSSNSAPAGCTDLVIQNDGNLVIYPSSLKAVWATGTRPTRLNPGDVLLAGQTIYAPGEQYKLAMQGDGNLVLHDDAGAPLWSSQTSGHPGSHAVMASTGELIVEDPAGSPLFSTPTSGHPGANLAVQDDGNLVVYSAGRAIWDTVTSAARPTGPALFGPPAFQACPPQPAPPPAPSVATPPAPSAPVVSVPITSPAPKRLRIKLILSWTWNHRTTTLHRIQIPHAAARDPDGQLLRPGLPASRPAHQLPPPAQADPLPRRPHLPRRAAGDARHLREGLPARAGAGPDPQRARTAGPAAELGPRRRLRGPAGSAAAPRA